MKAHAWSACDAERCSRVRIPISPPLTREQSKMMDYYEAWTKALKDTEIIRPRIQSLLTFKDTHVPYILLSESSVNLGDTVVRRGEVIVEKSALVLPPNIPQFDGFEFDGGTSPQDAIINFLLVRGVSIPSLHYNNKTYMIDVFEGNLKKAIAHYQEMLQHQENVQAGLMTGPEDCWQFSVIIYICSQIAKNADVDIRKLLEEYKKKRNNG